MSEVKFTINKGDYIDSREFTREECERFCEIAVECGYDRGEWMNYFCGYIGVRDRYLGVHDGMIFWHLSRIPCLEFEAKGNITAKFREFLDKEKGMNKFTKSDLESTEGLTATHRSGLESKVVLSHFVAYQNEIRLKTRCTMNEFNDDLSHFQQREFDIILVTDRDGTVLFEREEAPRELTIEEIAKAFNLPPERIRIKK